MAGIKGMKHRRPRTREERDQYALARIEELLDLAIEGKELKTWNPTRMKALEIRYNKLRASLSSTELTDRREGWVEALRRLAQPAKADQIVQCDEAAQQSGETRH